MYYVKIPLAYIGSVGSYNVPANEQQGEFDKRVASILADIRNNHIPGWATSYSDLNAVTVEFEDDEGARAMRDEDEVQKMADKAASLVRAAAPQAKTDYLRGVQAALDWVLNEDLEDDPL